ncbi:hypothetical protein [Halostreptopolyspora alba]
MTGRSGTFLGRVVAAVCAAFLVFGAATCEDTGTDGPTSEDGGGY